jgi:predicted TPR repeat methyltransferase
MLARARAKGVYDRLEQGDLQMLAPNPGAVDLVTAADVFLYVGRLERAFGTVSTMLKPDGVFAFSVEHHAGPEDVVLRESRRYAHSERHIRTLLANAGFEIVSVAAAPIRLDRAVPVEGLVVVAVRSSLPCVATVANDAGGAGAVIAEAPDNEHLRLAAAQ